MIAKNIINEPIHSLWVGKRFNTTILAKTPKTDSRLIKSDAITGGVYFWPTIWRVNAMPLDIIPAYKIGRIAEIMPEIVGVSNINARIVASKNTTKN